MFDLSGHTVIQGGMGVYVSSPNLAKEVSSWNGGGYGIGTVSGTAADIVLARILQKGDFDGSYRRALSHFPFPEIGNRVIEKYFVEKGIGFGKKFKPVPEFNFIPSRELIELTLCANFALVWLAKEDHNNPVFINYMEKLQMPHIYSIVGAMLAGVNGVAVGAGIARQFPALINAVLSGDELVYRVDVEGDLDGRSMRFNPREFFGKDLPKMEKPALLPIISSSALAKVMKKMGGVDGFIVELSTAGGHNAPPRGKDRQFDGKGNLLYDLEGRDKVDIGEIRSLGLPFWIGGSFGSPQKIAEAKSLGAAGVQVGSLFAFCRESGMVEGIKRGIVWSALQGRFSVKTSITASPTGFPFKVLESDSILSLSDPEVYEARRRVCNKGCLRKACFVDGKVVLRCPAEPVADYLRKGGRQEDVENRLCVCNGLFSAVDLGDDNEPPVITVGDDVSGLHHIVKSGSPDYGASEVMRFLFE